ncbi:hypothetical protein DFH09DRAFT_1318605 [Mycena vulgaris]|nr:hypothetical protein DFH09DRAFT_1318605 [Mycena vulgaris]
MDSSTLRLFADYNVALCTRDKIPDNVPLFYKEFAKIMNIHDDSDYAWAYVTSAGTIWFDDLKKVADANTFCVLDHELNRYIPDGELAVSTTYHANAECLAAAEVKRQVKYASKRALKRKINEKPAVLDSKEDRAAFAKRRKLLKVAATAAANAGSDIAASLIAGSVPGTLFSSIASTPRAEPVTTTETTLNETATPVEGEMETED